MASMSDDGNAATETLECDGPFEVLRLSPGVYQPLEIKRQYRRLALVLHPDKNRHPDAEAAFKKLTAAFENLHDPARQAMSRAEASGRQHRYTRRGTESSSSRSRGSSGDDGNYKADGHGDRGARSGGNGSGEAPRWCREGEYVPEAARKEEATTTDTGRRESRPIDEFMEDFEQQEKVFKEEVAQAKERNAENKRAKAEARAAADQERMNRLREDVLGSSDNSSQVEAKTASWQKFNAKTTPKRRKVAGVGGAAGRKEKTKTSIHCVSSAATPSAGPGELAIAGSQGEKHGSGFPERGGLRAGEGNDSRAGRGGAGGTVVGADPPNAVREKAAAGPRFVCLLCRRGFKSAKGLANHEANSELHEINAQLRDLMSPLSQVATHT